MRAVIAPTEHQPAGADLVSRVEGIFSPTGLLSRAKNFEFRPQQQEMAVAVARALQNRGHLAVEAGTGVGKSLAYLIPAILFAVNREYMGETPVGMTFPLAGNVGGGVQTPGFIGCGKVYLTSKKFLFAEGGHKRLVWMPSALKGQLGDDLKKRFEEQRAIGLMEKIADETTAMTAEELRAFLEKTAHPALAMEDMGAF